jgi:hypothetical protein
MSETTSILDLPTDPLGADSISNNIKMTANELSSINVNENQTNNSSMKLDQNTINQIVNGLQQATLSGATQLPSRDIPMNTNNLSNDPQIIPNYVPQPPQNQKDYIKNYEQTHDMVNNYNQKRQMSNSLDELYNEIQTPLLLAVLYFLFQLPFFKKFLYKYLPFLFSNDGNYNLNGFIFTSVLFGILFHFLIKVTGYFSTF